MSASADSAPRATPASSALGRRWCEAPYAPPARPLLAPFGTAFFAKQLALAFGLVAAQGWGVLGVWYRQAAVVPHAEPYGLFGAAAHPLLPLLVLAPLEVFALGLLAFSAYRRLQRAPWFAIAVACVASGLGARALETLSWRAQYRGGLAWLWPPALALALGALVVALV
ncbi:MAG: hypothetical protein H6828_13205, partial [Planctomycetes bacterium]|nr:hypothetical protein [Planctomycetota bacterium]